MNDLVEEKFSSNTISANAGRNAIRRKSLAGRPKKYLNEEERKNAVRNNRINFLKNHPDYKKNLYKKNKKIRNNKKRESELPKQEKPKIGNSDIKEYYKKYCNDNRSIMSIKRKIYKEKNRAKVRVYQESYYLINKKRINENSKRYRLKNADTRNYHYAKRRDRKFKIGESMDRYLYSKVYSKFNNMCFNCKSINKLSVDHHYPLVKGFSLTINNAVLLCKSCNSKKAAKLPEYFYSPEQLLDLEKNYGISRQSLKIVEQPILFETRMSKNLELDFGKVKAMNAV